VVNVDDGVVGISKDSDSVALLFFVGRTGGVGTRTRWWRAPRSRYVITCRRRDAARAVHLFTLVSSVESRLSPGGALPQPWGSLASALGEPCLSPGGALPQPWGSLASAQARESLGPSEAAPLPPPHHRNPPPANLFAAGADRVLQRERIGCCSRSGPAGPCRCISLSDPAVCCGPRRHRVRDWAVTGP
jgi:hypothetical protein